MELEKFKERIEEIRKIIREIKKLAKSVKAKKVEVRTSIPSLDVNFFIVIRDEDITKKQGIVIDIDFDRKTMIFETYGLRFSYFNELKYDPEKIVSIGVKYGEKFENDDGKKIKVEG